MKFDVVKLSKLWNINCSAGRGSFIVCVGDGRQKLSADHVIKKPSLSIDVFL
jgi:hypothetical protein